MEIFRLNWKHNINLNFCFCRTGRRIHKFETYSVHSLNVTSKWWTITVSDLYSIPVVEICRQQKKLLHYICLYYNISQHQLSGVLCTCKEMWLLVKFTQPHRYLSWVLWAIRAGIIANTTFLGFFKKKITTFLAGKKIVEKTLYIYPFAM